MSPLFLQKCEGQNGIFLSSSGQRGLENWEALTERAAPGESCLLCTNGLIILAKTTFVWLQDRQIQRKSSWLKHIQMCYDSVTFHKEDTMVLKSLITPKRSCRWEEISHGKAVSSLSTSSHLFHLMEIKIILCESIINLLYCLFQLPRVPEHKNVLKVDAVRNVVFKLGDNLQSSALTQGA